MTDEPGSIPTIEVARVSEASVAIVLQAIPGSSVEDHQARAKLHWAIMDLIEPELARYHASRSTVLAQRGTIGELQALVLDLVTQPVSPSASAYLLAMPLEDLQQFNRHVAVAFGGAGSMIGGIQRLGELVLPWLAQKIDELEHPALVPFVPEIRNAA